MYNSTCTLQTSHVSDLLRFEIDAVILNATHETLSVAAGQIGWPGTGMRQAASHWSCLYARQYYRLMRINYNKKKAFREMLHLYHAIKSKTIRPELIDVVAHHRKTHQANTLYIHIGGDAWRAYSIRKSAMKHTSYIVHRTVAVAVWLFGYRVSVMVD